MLTLSRRPGERLLIGGDIEIFVVSIVGGAVKLAIRAPRHVRVLRDELDRSPSPSERDPADAPSAQGG